MIFFYLVVERLPCNPQLGGHGSEVAVVLPDTRRNHLPFHLFECLYGHRSGSAFGKEETVRCQRIAVAQDDRFLDAVLQLPYVARLGVSLHLFNYFAVGLEQRLLVFRAVEVEEIIDQQRNIFRPFT